MMRQVKLLIRWRECSVDHIQEGHESVNKRTSEQAKKILRQAQDDHNHLIIFRECFSVERKIGGIFHSLDSKGSVIDM